MDLREKKRALLASIFFRSAWLVSPNMEKSCDALCALPDKRCLKTEERSNAEK